MAIGFFAEDGARTKYPSSCRCPLGTLILSYLRPTVSGVAGPFRSVSIGPAMHSPFYIALRSLKISTFQGGLTSREKGAELEYFSLDGFVVVGEGRVEFAAHPMGIRPHDIEFVLTKRDSRFA